MCTEVVKPLVFPIEDRPPIISRTLVRRSSSASENVGNPNMVTSLLFDACWILIYCRSIQHPEWNLSKMSPHFGGVSVLWSQASDAYQERPGSVTELQPMDCKGVPGRCSCKNVRIKKSGACCFFLQKSILHGWTLSIRNRRAVNFR